MTTTATTAAPATSPPDVAGDLSALSDRELAERNAQQLAELLRVTRELHTLAGSLAQSAQQVTGALAGGGGLGAIAKLITGR